MNERHLKDISEIKTLMNRSSRFISLSGLSGIFAGIYALLGVAIAYFIIFQHSWEHVVPRDWNFRTLIFLLGMVAVLSIATAVVLTTRNAKKNHEKIWDDTTRRLLINFLIPLLAGGAYILLNINSQHFGQTVAQMLIFYGLSLVNASKYTIGNVKYLGYAEILLGLICAVFPSFGFLFWAIGFGIFHIIYGSLMYHQEKNTKT